MRISKIFVQGMLIIVALQLLAVAVTVALTWAPDRPLKTLVQRWAPAPSAFINIKGLSVHVRDEGRRDDPLPIVLLHGTSASLHAWEGWVAALKSERRVITMDLPGFGLTGPNAQDDYRRPATTQFILDLLDTLGVQRCVLGGHSVGGEIAWQVAAAAPQRVDRLILVDAGGYPTALPLVPIGLRVARMPGLERLMELTLPRSVIASGIRNEYGDPERVTPALIDRYEELTLRAGNRHALGVRFAHTSTDADNETNALRIKTLRLPTLILWGGRDKLLPMAHAQQFQQAITGSQLMVFDDLGHVPHQEDAPRTVAAVKAFLKN